MRQYTIAKTLALFLGVLSVVARSFPERRSEINVRSPGDVSDPVLDGNIHYPTSDKTTFPKRVTSLEKRDTIDLQGHSCSSICSSNGGDIPNESDCNALYQSLSLQSFSVGPGITRIFKPFGTCRFVFVNPSPDTTFSYNGYGFGHDAIRIFQECDRDQKKNYASCVFGDVGGAHSPYVVVAHTDLKL